MERNQNTLQEAIEKAVDFLKNRNDDINRTSPHCKYQVVSLCQLIPDFQIGKMIRVLHMI